MNKGNNAWILCPSKSFPGKLYYFNVINGEAAWCLTETEKKVFTKESTIKKVSDKSHSYPERSTPPTVEGPDIPNMFYNFTAPPSIPLNYQMGPPQIYGQPVFSRYIPNHYMPEYMMPMPHMLVANKPAPKKRSFDQITQTSDDQVPCVQGFTIPLSERFGSYRQFQVGNETSEEKVICSRTPNKGKITTTDKVNWWNTDSSKMNVSVMQGSVLGSKLNHSNKITERATEQNPFKCNFIDDQKKIVTSRYLRDPVLTMTENLCNHKSNQKSNVIQTPTVNRAIKTEIENNNQGNNAKPVYCSTSLTVKNLYANAPTENCYQNKKCEDVPNHSVQKLCFNVDSVGESLNKINEAEDEPETQSLNNTDLRFVLQAKRRKVVLTNEMSLNAHKEVNKIKGKKKQVTFNLQNLEEIQEASLFESDLDNDKINNISVAQPSTGHVINISYLKSLSNEFLTTDPWYVIVDYGVLLQEYEFIEEFVKKDITCRCLVPHSVRAYIESMSLKEYAGRSWVVMARKAMRRLAAPGQHVVLQPPLEDKSSTSIIDNIIECCLKVLQSNHAVLITMDKDLYNKALSTSIDTYQLDDIKHSLASEPNVSFRMGKINVQINNDNMFLQNTKDFDPFALSKNNYLLSNESNNFKVPTTVTENKSSKINSADTNKPNISDKSSHFETTPEHKNKPNLDVNRRFDSNIEHDIKMLSLHENTTTNKKLFDDIKGISHRKCKPDYKNIIISTNVLHDNKTDESNPQGLKIVRTLNPLAKYFVNTSNNLKKQNPEVSSTSEFRKSIKPMIVSVPVKLQSTDSTVTGDKRLNINAYTVEELLKTFRVKDVTTSQRIESRLDEWICVFYQIMEECLTDILMNNLSSVRYKLSAPWSLPEAVVCLQEAHSSNTAIKTVTDKLCSVLSHLSDKNGNLRSKIKPADFMKLFGCGVLLLESLKSIAPQSAQVTESENLLNKLLKHIQNPSEDVELPVTSTRVTSCEIDDIECAKRSIVQKKPSDIIEYLKKHFPAWKDYDEKNLIPEITNVQNKVVRNETTVVRSFGKCLNTIRITKENQITFDDTPSHKGPEHKENIKINVEKDVPLPTRFIRTVDAVEKDIGIDFTSFDHQTVPTDKGEYKDIKKKTNVNSVVEDENKSKTTTYKNRNDLMEDANSIGSCLLNDDTFADDMAMEFGSNAVCFVDEKHAQKNDFIQCNDEDDSLFEKDNDKTTPDNNNINDTGNCNDSTDDSGFVNQSVEACSFIRMFLSELSSSFKHIYNFIDTNIQELRSVEVRLEDKKVAYDKANEVHLYVADIIGKLKRIIDREANDKSKLKSLVINAGVEGSADKRLTRYRNVIMKCLEQAQLLEGALKIVLALTNEHCDLAVVDVDRSDEHVPYFNIFE